MVTAVSNKALRSAKASLTCSSRVHARVHAWKTVVAVAVNWMGGLLHSAYVYQVITTYF